MEILITVTLIGLYFISQEIVDQIDKKIEKSKVKVKVEKDAE